MNKINSFTDCEESCPRPHNDSNHLGWEHISPESDFHVKFVSRRHFEAKGHIVKDVIVTREAK